MEGGEQALLDPGADRFGGVVHAQHRGSVIGGRRVTGGVGFDLGDGGIAAVTADTDDRVVAAGKVRSDLCQADA